MKVSNIIPTHNRKEIIYTHLLALERQDTSLDDFEVIVFCDNCTDGTEELLSPLIEHVSYSLSILSGDTGKRYGLARNNAARTARAELLVFQDDECIPYMDNFSLFLTTPGSSYDWVTCGWVSTENNSAWINYWSRLRQWDSCLQKGVGQGPWDIFIAGNMAVPTKTFWELQGFDEEIVGWYGDDADFAYRAFKAGHYLDYLSKAQVINLLHPPGFYAQDKENEEERMRTKEINTRYLSNKHGKWPTSYDEVINI